MKIIIATLIIIVSGIFTHYLFFKNLTNDDILAYGWKGDGCSSDVLDFRNGHFTLQGNDLYAGEKFIGRIASRHYRLYADSYIEIYNESGETCLYFGKWKN